MDNIQGTGGNDTIIAYYNQTANSTDSTLNPTDVIKGGAGIDTLKLTTAGTPVSFNGADIQGIEIVDLRATANTGSITLNMAGLTEFNSDRSTGTVEATNLNAGAAVGLKGDGNVVLGNVAVSYAASATSATLNISGGVGPAGTTAPAVTIAGTGATTATINSTGAANTIGALALGTAGVVTNATINASTNLTTGAVTAAGLKTLTVKGAGAVNLSANALSTTVTSIDASDNTGGVTVTSGAKSTAFKGGAGNDKLTIGTLVYDASAKIDGGAGTNTLAIADSTATLFTTAAKANISNFQVLEVSGVSKTFDFTALTGLTALNIAAATSATINKLGAATPVTIVGDQATGLTINVADATNPLNTSDSLTLTLDKAGPATATSIVTVANITSDGLETLNIVSSGVKTANTAATTDNNVISSLAGLSTSNVSVINVSGASDIDITTGAISRVVNIKATNATGNVSVNGDSNGAILGFEGGSGNDKFMGAIEGGVMKGGAGNDVLISGAFAGTAKAVSMTGGAGADLFVFGGTDAANMLNSSIAATTMKITDFSYTDGDKIELYHGTAGQIFDLSGGTKVTPSALHNAGKVTAATLALAATAAYADADQVTTGANALGANEAVFFTWNDGTADRTFLSVDNGTGAYTAADDMIIEVTGIVLKSGDAALGTLVVSDYFA